MSRVGNLPFLVFVAALNAGRMRTKDDAPRITEESKIEVPIDPIIFLLEANLGTLELYPKTLDFCWRHPDYDPTYFTYREIDLFFEVIELGFIDKSWPDTPSPEWYVWRRTAWERLRREDIV